MSDGDTGTWKFESERLMVGPWHEMADRFGFDLAQVIAELLTVRTTVALPEPWRGDQSVDSAQDWIADRDAEAAMLLVIESTLPKPVGILVTAEIPQSDEKVDLRIGYLFAEADWGRGLATELVEGLIAKARTQARIRTISRGVDPTNRASARVLEKCGFGLVDESGADSALYRIET